MNRRIVALLSTGAAISMAAMLAPSASASATSHAPTGVLRPGGLIHLLAPPHGGASTSTNWAGYVNTAGGGPYTQSSASFVQPAINCSSGKATYSSFWVGIGGYTTSQLDQTGTEADCSGGNATYKAWWEVLPAGETLDPSVSVHPGDSFTATVTGSGGVYTMTLRNNTTGQQFSHSQTDSANTGQSAEVIAEATSLCTILACRVQPLSNFGTVNFTNGTANGVPIANKPNDVVTMAGGGGLFGGGTVKAQPSSLSGGNFSVTWKHT